MASKKLSSLSSSNTEWTSDEIDQLGKAIFRGAPDSLRWVARAQEINHIPLVLSVAAGSV